MRTTRSTTLRSPIGVGNSGSAPVEGLVRGVDACKGGWLCVSAPMAGGEVTAELFPADAQKLFAKRHLVTAIDVPIGLPDVGDRAADREARRLLGRRSSSVFSTPNRAVLGSADFAEACRRSLVARNTRLSLQTFDILPRISAVDSCLRGDPTLLDSVREVHPELSFRAWNGGRPMKYGKKTGFGFLQRLELVRSVFGSAAEAIREHFPVAAVADDDILDALAALWTARRIARGAADRVPAEDEHDAHGLPMVMWA